MAERGVYTVSGEFAVTTAKTLISVFATAGAVFDLLEVEITQRDSETNEQAGVNLLELTADDGTNTATTPAPHNEGDNAAVCTGNVNYTVEPTAGTVIKRWGFNLLNGLFYAFPERSAPQGGVGTAQGLALELLAAPGASTTFCVNMTFRERLL